MAGCGEGETASVVSNAGGNKNENEGRRSSIVSCAGGSHATSGGRSVGTNTHTTSPTSGTNGPTTRTVSNGMKRKLRSVTRAASASRDVFCHVLPTKKPRRGFDGKFIRPIGRPPVEGFIWDPVGGYWIPRGVAGLSPPKKYDPTHSNAAAGDDQQSLSSHSSTTSSKSTSSSSSSASSSSDENDINDYRKGSANIRVQLCDSTPSTWNQQQMKQQQKTASTKQKGIAEIGKYHSTSTNATSAVPARLTHNRSRKLSKAIHKLSSSADALHSMQSSSSRHDVKYHIGSMWKEPCPIDGTVLTLYERHRKPRPVPTGKHYCSIKALQQEFRCVICLGYIRNARVVKECLHRFCEVCIEKALIQFGKRNECPICRVYIPTRRSLAPDPNFDRLIQCILKDIAFEEDDDNVVTNNNSKNSTNNSNKNTASGTAISTENAAARQAAELRARALQEAVRKKRLAAIPTTTTTTNTNTADTPTMVCEIIDDNTNSPTTTTTSADTKTIIPEPCQQQQQQQQQHEKQSEESNSNSDDIVMKSPQQSSVNENDGDKSLSIIGIENDSMKMPPPAPLSLVGNQSIDIQQQQPSQQQQQQQQQQQTGTLAKSPMSPPDGIVKIVLLPYDNNNDEDNDNSSNNGTKTYNTLPQLQQPFLTVSGTAPVKILRRFLEIKLCCPRLQICSTIVISDTKNNNRHNNNNNSNHTQNLVIDDSANETTTNATTIINTCTTTTNNTSTTGNSHYSTTSTNTKKVVTYRDSKTIEEIAMYAGRKSMKRRNSISGSTSTTTRTTMNNNKNTSATAGARSTTTTVDGIGDYIPIYYRLAPTTSIVTITTPTTVATSVQNKSFPVGSTGTSTSSNKKKKSSDK